MALPLLLVAACTTPVQAGVPRHCGKAVEQALREASSKAPVQGEVTASDCTPWPSAAGAHTAAVIAFEQPADIATRQRRWVVVLAVLDRRTSRVLHAKQTAPEEDAAVAIGPDSLRLDTARFEVRPGVQALGLRFRSAARAPSAGKGWLGDELSLFIPAAGDLRPVFSASMSAQESITGVLNAGSPGATWWNTRISLTVGARAPGSWHELRLTETRSRDGVEGVRVDKTPQRRTYPYVYDGDRYRIQARRKPAWAAVENALRW